MPSNPTRFLFKQVHRNENFFFLSSFLILIIAYLPLLEQKTFTNYDDLWLVTTASKFKYFFFDYFNKTHIDFQPIRDITFLYDYLFQQVLGVFTYKITNLFIFYFFWVGMVKTIQTQYGWNKEIAVISILILLHPVFANAICWIASRKQLLATLYLTFSVYSYLIHKEKQSAKYFFYSILFYIFSILSHPIYILWPFAMIADGIKNDTQRKLFSGKKNLQTGITVFFFCLFLTINLKYYYFTTKYYSNIHFSEYFTGRYFGDLILTTSRYLHNSIFPESIFFFYSKASVRNFIGMVLLGIVIFILIFKKRIINKKHHLFLSIALVNIIPVTIHKMDWFVSDTYCMLFASVTFFIFLYSIISLENKFFTLYLPLLFIFFSFKTNSIVRSWGNYETMLEENLKKEWSAQALNQYIITLLSKNQTQKASRLLKDNYGIINELREQSSSLIPVFAQSIYFSKNMTREDKISILEDYKNNKNLFLGFFLSLLYIEIHQPQLAFATMNENFFYRDNGLDAFYDPLALYHALCSRHGTSNCNKKFTNLVKTINNFSEVKFKQCHKKWTEYLLKNNL